MSTSTDYNEMLPVIRAIKANEVLTSNMPIDVFVQEAENLYHWCLDDEQALTPVAKIARDRVSILRGMEEI